MNAKSTVLTSLIVLVAGVVLCYAHARENIPHTIVFITGITLIVPGLINLVLLFGHRNDARHRPTATMKIVGWISSVAAVGLGALMIIAPGLFTPVLIYVFGVVMAFASLALIYVISRQDSMPLWLYVGPVLVLIAGVVMVCMGQPRITDQMMTLITGMGMIVFAVSCFAVVSVVARNRREARKTVTPDKADVPVAPVGVGTHEPVDAVTKAVPDDSHSAGQ